MHDLAAVRRRAFLIAAGITLAACAGGGRDTHDPLRLTLGAYTTPREAYREIIPLFQAAWKSRTGEAVVVDESYLGSGAQSRAVVEGFEADVVALAMEPDVSRIAAAGLITHDWRATQHRGIVSTSVVALAVRQGNPNGILDWGDLVTQDVEILTPDPRTSGGAQWNVLAMYGAVERGFVDGYGASDESALEFLTDVFRRVTVLDRSARDSITNFEKGVGDVAISYENEIRVGQQAGLTYELVVPRSTILIENPVAVVDEVVEAHGTRAVAEGFRDFLWSAEAQRVFARHGLRPVRPEVAAESADQNAPIEDLFTLAEQFGTWANVTEPFFGERGLYIRMLATVQRRG